MNKAVKIGTIISLLTTVAFRVSNFVSSEIEQDITRCVTQEVMSDTNSRVQEDKKNRNLKAPRRYFDFGERFSVQDPNDSVLAQKGQAVVMQEGGQKERDELDLKQSKEPRSPQRVLNEDRSIALGHAVVKDDVSAHRQGRQQTMSEPGPTANATQNSAISQPAQPVLSAMNQLSPIAIFPHQQSGLSAPSGEKGACGKQGNTSRLSAAKREAASNNVGKMRDEVSAASSQKVSLKEALSQSGKQAIKPQGAQKAKVPLVQQNHDIHVSTIGREHNQLNKENMAVVSLQEQDSLPVFENQVNERPHTQVQVQEGTEKVTAEMHMRDTQNQSGANLWDKVSTAWQQTGANMPAVLLVGDTSAQYMKWHPQQGKYLRESAASTDVMSQQIQNAKQQCIDHAYADARDTGSKLIIITKDARDAGVSAETVDFSADHVVEGAVAKVQENDGKSCPALLPVVVPVLGKPSLGKAGEPSLVGKIQSGFKVAYENGVQAVEKVGSALRDNKDALAWLAAVMVGLAGVKAGKSKFSADVISILKEKMGMAMPVDFAQAS